MDFYIGQRFEGSYPLEAAEWSNCNGAVIVPLEGNVFEIQELPKVSDLEILKIYEDAVQAHLDSVAQSRGYDNTYTCLSYLNSTNDTWKTESNIFNAWRDSVWEKAHEILNAFTNKEIEQPTVDEVLDQLPVIQW